MQAELLVDCDNILGEGVQWNADLQRLWWTDIHGRRLWNCDADGARAEAIELSERLGSFAFDQQNRILAAFESGLFRLDLDADRCERLTEFEPDQPTTRYNDGRCDPAGRFVVGGMNEDGLKPTSSLTRYDGQSLKTLATGIGVSNSICFSPDGRWMYFTDTPTRTIRRYPYDPETGDIGKAQPFYLTPDRAGYPDGTCVDENGALWNARFWGGCVQQILADASNGARVEVPAPQVTSYNKHHVHLSFLRHNV